MKNVCFITQCSLPIPTVKGGAVETLVEYLLVENEKEQKYNITIISVYDCKADTESKKYKNANFIYVPKGNKLINSTLHQIYRVLKHLNIYIPFSTEFHKALKVIKKLPKQDIYVYEAGPTTQLPALSQIVGKENLVAHLHWDGMGNRKKDKYFSYLLPVSQYIGNQWKNNTDCNSEKIIPLYNCAKIERFMEKSSVIERKKLKESLNIPEENSVIIFTGRIVQEKGIKELLQAFSIIENKNVSLIIIGSADFGNATNTVYEKEVSKIIEQCDKQVVATGFVHQTQLYKYYNLADIAVIPSLFQDPAPLVCIETQATGTPLIATKVGGISEYTTDESAILIEKDEKLVENIAKKIDYLLDNPDIMEKMSEKAIENAKQYNTKNYFVKFSEVIDGIMERKQ